MQGSWTPLASRFRLQNCGLVSCVARLTFRARSPPRSLGHCAACRAPARLWSGPPAFSAVVKCGLSQLSLFPWVLVKPSEHWFLQAICPCSSLSCLFIPVLIFRRWDHFLKPVCVSFYMRRLILCYACYTYLPRCCLCCVHTEHFLLFSFFLYFYVCKAFPHSEKREYTILYLLYSVKLIVILFWNKNELIILIF